MVDSLVTNVEYRYFTTDLLTNTVIAEVPFKGVSYERALKAAGSFSGSIPLLPKEESAYNASDMYEATMPGQTGLYVVRNNEVVWGGIIWSRSYNVNDRKIEVSASEFTSYFQHRRIWKTWGHTLSGTLICNSGVITAKFDYGTYYQVAKDSTVRFEFYDEYFYTYSGYYKASQDSSIDPEDGLTTFRTLSTPVPKEGVIYASLPDGTYENVTIIIRANTYDYVRSLIEAVSQDFSGIEFANSEIRPSLDTELVVLSKSASGRTATLVTESNHGVILGQQITVESVDPELDGTHIVTEAYENVIKYILPYDVTISTANVSSSLNRVSFRAASSGVATVVTAGSHGLYSGQTVTVDRLDTPNSATLLYDGKYSITVVNTNSFSYSSVSGIEQPLTALEPATATLVGGSGPTNYITTQQVTTPFVTIQTADEHGFDIGDTVNVSGIFNIAEISYRKLENGLLTYNTSSPHGFAAGNPVTVSGISDVTLIASRALSISGNVGTFTITTEQPHNLEAGDTVTVAGLSDTYDVTAYSYGSNAITFTTSQNHNIRVAEDIDIVIAGIPGNTYNATFIEVDSNRVTITTAQDHGFQVGDSITVSGFPQVFIAGNDPVEQQVTKNISSISRANGIVTVTTTASHGYTSGKQVTIDSAIDTFNGSFNITNVTSNTSFTYSSAGITGSYSANSATYPLIETSSTSEDGGFGTAFFLSESSVNPPAAGSNVTISGVSEFSGSYPLLPGYFNRGGNNTSITFGLIYTSIQSPRINNTSNTIFYNIYTNGRFYNQTVNWQITVSGSQVASGSFSDSGIGAGATGSVVYTGTQGTYHTVEVIVNGSVRMTTQIRVGSSGGVVEVYQPTAGYNILGGSINFAPSSGLSVVGTCTSSALVGGTSGTYVESPANGTHTVTDRSTYQVDFDVSGDINEIANSAPTTLVRLSGPSSLNASYTGVLSRTNNTFTVTTDRVGTQANTAVSATTASVRQSAFNINNATVFSVPNATAITYAVNTAAYTHVRGNVASTTDTLNGTVSIFPSDLNVVNANIVSASGNTFTVNSASTRTVAYGAATSGAIARSASAVVGEALVTGVPNTRAFSYAKTGVASINLQDVYGYATANSIPLVRYGTYGAFTYNSDIGFEFSTSAYSENNVTPVLFRGFEVRNVGEELDKYADTLDGFEYRIDCYLDQNQTFKRRFVLLPINVAAGVIPEEGQPLPVSAFGADNLVFEFPGNISDLQIEESAENAVTRFFMVGNIGDLGSDISQPYAVASATDLLQPSDPNSRAWPLLDDDESDNDAYDEEILYSYAERYLTEGRPPDAKISVSVNGSLDPVVGTYSPGDWCSLVIDDEFIRQRLASDLEPRDDVIVRKIESFSVSVPDSVTFPEKIELRLVAEWQVDKIA